MSIQENLHKGLVYRAFLKFRIIQLYDQYLFLKQYLLRKFILLFHQNKKNPNVFFEYYNHYTHPGIKKRYYGKNAPLSWVNLNLSEVSHIINFSEKLLGKKIIFEPNDCCQKLGSLLNINEPCEFVARCKEIDDYIATKVISRVLVGNNDLIKHAEYYFSDSVLSKFITYPEMSCIPKVSKFFIEEKNKKLLINPKIRFLSIASDFKKKAVDLLIEAFIESKSLNTLILVCHNIPESYKVKILKAKNIKLLENIPLSKKIKDDLHRNSDVYINTTYVDGGGTVANALEYGLPIITFTYHRGRSYISNGNGVLLSEPLKYYDPKSYGIHWNSIDGYLEQVFLLKNKGGYESVKKQLIDSIIYYQQYPQNVLVEGLKSLELAKKNSLDKANQFLKNLYKQVASE
jgi:hypothetical protein